MPNRFGTKYDFAGQIINKLRVERYIGKSRWECTCLECGKITNKTSKDLETKRAYSCGCCTRYTDVDLTGQQFEKLIAQYRVKGKDGRILWHCTCSCNSGKTVDVRASDLLKGKVKSCGCMKHRNKAENLIGKTFGRLKVIAREPNDKDGRAVWKCKCECGNETIVTGKRLLNGSTKSCGCLRHESNADDISGQRFGHLVAQYRLKDTELTYWHCKCDCGNEKDILYSSLKNGFTKSCGCYRSEFVSNKNKTDALEVRPVYPQWFIDELAHESDKKRAISRELTTNENIDFVCPTHGIYNQTVSNHIRLKDGKHVYGCPSCSSNVAHRGSKAELEIRDFVEELLRLKYDAKEN